MNEKDRWNGHLEFARLVITLATALLTVSAVAYSNSSMTTSPAIYIVFATDLAVFLTLVAGIVTAISLSNHLLKFDASDPAIRIKRANRITFSAGLSFLFLLLSGVGLLSFFVFRAFFSN